MYDLTKDGNGNDLNDIRKRMPPRAPYWGYGQLILGFEKETLRGKKKSGMLLTCSKCWRLKPAQGFPDNQFSPLIMNRRCISCDIFTLARKPFKVLGINMAICLGCDDVLEACNMVGFDFQAHHAKLQSLLCQPCEERRKQWLQENPSLNELMDVRLMRSFELRQASQWRLRNGCPGLQCNSSVEALTIVRMPDRPRRRSTMV